MTTLSAKHKRLLGFGCLLGFILLLWAFPLLSHRLGHQNDIVVHLRWADQFSDAVKEGWLLPRWAHASRSGLGDPAFLFYQPLFYYLTTGFALLGLQPETVLICAAIVPYLLLGAIVYISVLRRYPNHHALLGAMFVVGCPLLYFLSAYLAGFPWSLSIPFSLLFAIESTRDRPRPHILAPLLCLICLSHLLSGLITLLCTALARLLFAFPGRNTIQGHLSWAAGVILGFALSAFFVYPALTQMHLITPSGWTEGNGFDWRRRFIFPIFTSVHWFAIQWPFAVLTLGMVILVMSLKDNKAPTPMGIQAHRLALIGVAAMLFATELAYPLYAAISPLQKIQFPYRFIFLACILANLALAIQLAEGAWARRGRAARAAIIVLVAAQCAQTAYLQWSLARHGERMPDRSSFMRGDFGQPEYVPAVRGPQWKAYVDNGKLTGECRHLGIVCNDVRQRSHDLSATIETPRAVGLRMPLFAVQGWGVSVDGQQQALLADPDTGLILVRLSPGRHLVTLRWSGLPVEVTGRAVSLAALVILLALLLVSRLRRGREVANVAFPAAPVYVKNRTRR